MSQDDEPIESLDLLGERLTEAAEVGPASASRSVLRRPWFAIPIVLVVLIGLALTPPGRAVTGDLAALVGIGEVGGAPTQPSKVGRFDPASDQIVLAAGELADGQRYEIVAFRSNERITNRGDDAICVNVEFPGRPMGSEGSCYSGAPNHGGLCCSSVTVDGDANSVARIEGKIEPGIERVEVTYIDDSGQEESIDADIGMITPEFAARLEVDHPSGMFVASLPGLATAVYEPFPLGAKEPVEISVFDADGVEVESETYRPDAGLEAARELNERREEFDAYLDACGRGHAERAETPECERLREAIGE